MVTWMMQNTREILFMILKFLAFALCYNRRAKIVCMLSRNVITLKVLEHS